jgi:predicted nucleotidyltransferase
MILKETKMILMRTSKFEIMKQGVVELKKYRGKEYSYAKVALGRSVKRGSAIKVSRGVYFIPSPENVSKLLALADRKIVYQVVKSAYEEFHRNLKLVLIYGSYARGDFDSKSDVDVLVVADGNGRGLADKLSKKLSVKIDLKVITEQYFRRLMVVEPKVHFWLKEGITFDEAGITKEVYPIGRIGVYEALQIARAQIELAREADFSDKGYYLLVAIRELLTLKHALNLDFDYKNVKNEFVKVAGGDALEILRSKRGKGVGREQLRAWAKRVDELYLELEQAYKSLGESLGDLYMKKFVRRAA